MALAYPVVGHIALRHLFVVHGVARVRQQYVEEARHDVDAPLLTRVQECKFAPGEFAVGGVFERTGAAEIGELARNQNTRTAVVNAATPG